MVLFFQASRQNLYYLQTEKKMYPKLTFKNNFIKYNITNKFLSLIFDKKLNFIPHVNYLKRTFIKTINIIKV